MPYWYLFSTRACPVCGRERTDKVRVYDRPKPADLGQRHEWLESYDYCDV